MTIEEREREFVLGTYSNAKGVRTKQGLEFVKGEGVHLIDA